jgi:hypothetical protein
MYQAPPRIKRPKVRPKLWLVMVGVGWQSCLLLR